MSKSVRCTLLTLALLLISAAEIEARKRGRRSQKEVDVEERYAQAWRIVRNCFLLAIAPLIAVFIHSLATDPSVPHIARALLEEVKSRFMSNIGDACSEKR